MNIGTVYSALLNKPDSSLYFNQKAIPFLKKHGDVTTLALNYNNQGLQYKLKNKYKEAIHYYSKALSTPIRKNVTKTKLVFYENLAEAYALNKNYEQSTKYLNLINQLKDSINESKQNIAISEINEKYNNEKLRADNLEIDSKRKKNKFLLIGTSIVLVLGTVIFLLIQKNTLRKQRLAEKEKELETQKLATVLKEQELTTIDAMIEGQEKERIRIANDLHDDLGSLLANVKLHFDALKEKKSEDLYNKTNLLIDETYQKVRSIAHAKNSGVIAKQGLLKAVQQLASKTSLSNKIEINVIDHGLEERLENSLELSIFRIIQELITNILKHAYATEASIYLTCFDHNLNIMVEDNGKGFNSRKTLKKNTGMGIHSIDKRVEHLNGTMTIESEPKNGTTIIIDLPI
jgi:two-component system, NarL family, sensor histidine kinase DegS